MTGCTPGHAFRAKKCFVAQPDCVTPRVHSNEPAFLSATRAPFTVDCSISSVWSIIDLRPSELEEVSEQQIRSLRLRLYLNHLPQFCKIYVTPGAYPVAQQPRIHLQ